MRNKIIDVQDIVIRFAGDSGDGMQLTGTLFADASALFGNGISTFPDYPAEIRAPRGTVAGVSGFQVHIGNGRIKTPGDYCDALVAMNPAALMANAKWLKPGGSIVLDIDAFDAAGLETAGFKTLYPLKELNLEDHHVVWAPITSLTKESLKDSGLDNKSILRCKNIFTLGMCYFMFNRPLEFTENYIERKFGKKKPLLVEPNKKVLNDGYNYAHNIHAIASTYRVAPAELDPGEYRNINGNQAAAWGLLAASEKSGRPLFIGSYPITPATEILEEIALHKELGAKSLQCEDEIASICTAIGASYAGNLAVTSTSGPGLSLKSEGLGLATMAELPLVVIDVQRGGPSTGLPTKTEQADLNQALYGRNGECPVMVMASKTPSDCFRAAYYAAKFAMEHMMPVILLSESFLGKGSEPWKIPDMKDFPEIKPPVIKHCDGKFKPYMRDPETFVRNWAIPGTPGLEHRIGGLEKNEAGEISYNPANHEKMVENRAAKVAKLADYYPAFTVEGSQNGDVLVVGWGGTYGHLSTAVKEMNDKGLKVGLAHFDYIFPLPHETEAIFSNFGKIIVCELNSGQFANYLRANLPQFKYLQFNKIQGLPFMVHEITDAVEALIPKNKKEK
ncbi:MAG: 2-oxoacid:acceptor oxidoreductase subunit alpha [Bacteroidales bacterium]|jgi:2-oxoglutarate ferredoxin oxidoreductase subunit alpha|nr:2-oxoacid:acceptor oxidoreductase subunit alpha [Bacteroidales bacterium]